MAKRRVRGSLQRVLRAIGDVIPVVIAILLAGMYVPAARAQALVVICPPEDVTVYCDESTLPKDIGEPVIDSMASDIEPSIMGRDSIVPGDCDAEYTIVRVWIITDVTGETATCTQAIHVVNRPPVCRTKDITIDTLIDVEKGYIILGPEMIDDSSYAVCGGPVSLRTSPDTLTCLNEGPNIVTLIVKDECGDTSACEAVVYFHCIDPCIRVETWVYLEGAAADPSGDTLYTVPMRTSLNDQHKLPGQTYSNPFFGDIYTPPGQPYLDFPWNYPGLEGDLFDSQGDTTAGDAGYPSMAVDWVLVSLRIAPADTPVWRAAALVFQDGSVELIAGSKSCELDRDTMYYILVEHRNHLPVMSHVPVAVHPTESVVRYDFRHQQSYIDDPLGFGASAGQKLILPDENVFAMFAGNGDQSSTPNADTDINLGDRAAWEISNGSSFYRNSDYNLNGDTNHNDRVVWVRNNGTIAGLQY